MIATPEQIVCDDGLALTFGVGFTRMVTFIGEPGQPLRTGIIVKNTGIGIVVLFIKTPVIFPEPFGGNPVAVVILFLLQLNTVPLKCPLKITGITAEPEQIVCEAGDAIAVGTGFTCTVTNMGCPVQLFAIGVIVNVTIIGLPVLFINGPEILPVPVPAIPPAVMVLSLTQLNIVPLTLLVNTIVVMLPLAQIVCEEGVAIAFGVGFINTVAMMGVPAQLLAVGVIVKVTVIGLFVVFVNNPLIFPEPVPAIPVTVDVLFLVQV